MSDAQPPWLARLSPQTAGTVEDLPDHVREMLRDVLDIAGRDPWSFPPFNSRDPEGEDVRSASVGVLTHLAGPDMVVDLYAATRDLLTLCTTAPEGTGPADQHPGRSLRGNRAEAHQRLAVETPAPRPRRGLEPRPHGRNRLTDSPPSSSCRSR
jgi:hypothetical protein